jgi:hypothetical protein
MCYVHHKKGFIVVKLCMGNQPALDIWNCSALYHGLEDMSYFNYGFCL